MDDTDASSPEVTISPADNGHVVRWHQRGTKKDEPGRAIKRVAFSKEDALGHAGEALGGGSRTKKKSSRDGQLGTAGSGEESDSSPSAHDLRSPRSRGSRRRPVRSRRRV